LLLVSVIAPVPLWLSVPPPEIALPTVKESLWLKASVPLLVIAPGADACPRAAVADLQRAAGDCGGAQVRVAPQQNDGAVVGGFGDSAARNRDVAADGEGEARACFEGCARAAELYRAIRVERERRGGEECSA
jgi:hypothetical protein